MAKYDPLTRYLRRQAPDKIVLTFHEIETLLNSILPKRARQADWWANEPRNGAEVQTGAWLRAGYHAFAALDRERVTFQKIGRDARAPSRGDKRLDTGEAVIGA